MGNEPSEKDALDAAYRFLTHRPHSRMELQRKLARKNFGPEEIEKALGSLCRQGYVNDEEISLRWSQSLVRERGWGKAKIAFYLIQKGINSDIINRVQQIIWQEFSEEETARKALKKRFSPDNKNPLQAKAAAFLKSRGFSSEVIYKLVNEL
jgi:regulatory protein